MDGRTSSPAETAHASPRPPAVRSETALGSHNAHAHDDQTASPQGVQLTPGRALDGPFVHRDVDQQSRTPSPSPKMRPRPRMTIDLAVDPMDALFDRKVSVEDHSPKPCIVPGNALHLIDDDPSPRSQTPSSVIIIDDADDMPRAQSADADRSSSEPPPPRAAPRVRFRSRVRITSGVHRHRHGTQPAPGARRDGTPCSSNSDSPSSSISAPLRYQADENAPWGPLGKRLSAYASRGGWQKRPAPVMVGPQAGVAETRARASGGMVQPNERTPLVQHSRRQTSRYVSHDDNESNLDEGEGEEDEEEALRREQDEVFGPWPRRLVNRHWWWWHLEPIVCCLYCSDDCDWDE